MEDENTAQRLRFMELVQKCLPFKWRRYWDCGFRYFDVLMMLRDTENPDIGRRDRLLLGILARIGSERNKPLRELIEATRTLDLERRRIVRRWLEHEEGRHLPLAASAEPLLAPQSPSSLLKKLSLGDGGGLSREAGGSAKQGTSGATS
jgi:hypothetical protein